MLYGKQFTKYLIKSIKLIFNHGDAPPFNINYIY